MVVELEGQIVRGLEIVGTDLRSGFEPRLEALCDQGEVCIDEQDRPEQYAHQQSRSGLVDLDLFLEGDPQDAQHEDHRHEIVPKHKAVRLERVKVDNRKSISRSLALSLRGARGD